MLRTEKFKTEPGTVMGGSQGRRENLGRLSDRIDYECMGRSLGTRAFGVVKEHGDLPR